VAEVNIREFRALLEEKASLERQVAELRERAEEGDRAKRAGASLRREIENLERRVDRERSDKLGLRAQVEKQEKLIQRQRREALTGLEERRGLVAELSAAEGRIRELEEQLENIPFNDSIISSQTDQIEELRAEIERLRPHEQQTRALTAALDQARRLA
jgi:chromosome segregation ATPase